MGEDRCQVCGAKYREAEAVKCHECGAARRNTFLPEEPAGAPIPDAAASLATEQVVSPAMDPSASSSAMGAAASSSAMGPAPAPAPAPAEVQIDAPTVPFMGSISELRAAAAQPGAPLPGTNPQAPPPEAALQAAATRAPGVPAPAPKGLSQPIPRKVGARTLMLAMLGGAVVAIAGLVVYYVVFLKGPSEAETDKGETPISISARGLEPPGCAELEALAGSWVFTTATTNARKEARIGMRGFFEVQVDVKDCSAEATLVKIGRKGKPTFAEHKKPKAVARLTPGVGFYAFGFGGHFELKNEDGQGVPLRITFAREGEQLVGAWRQVGPRWETSGMYGVLVGERTGDPRKLRVRRKEQPCPIQCATPPDVAQMDTPDLAQIEACRSACG